MSIIHVPKHTEITVEQLAKVHEERRNIKKQVYDSIFIQCCDKIRHINDQFYMTSCYFTVPGIQHGRPMYSLETCIVYLMYKLKKKGFYVDYAPPNRIYISWDRALTKALKNSDREWHKITTEQSKMATTTISSGSGMSIEDIKKEFMNEDSGGKVPGAPINAPTTLIPDPKRWDYDLIQKKNLEESRRAARVLRRGANHSATLSNSSVSTSNRNVSFADNTGRASIVTVEPQPETPPKSRREIEREMQRNREQMKIESIIKQRDQNARFSQNFNEKKKNNKKFLQITT
jgi:hypothetical protein